jgi:tetratricopeptide (TPR) repeat protein
MQNGRPRVVALNFAENRVGDKSMFLPSYDGTRPNFALPVSSFLAEATEILEDESHDLFCDALQAAKDGLAEGKFDQALESAREAMGLQPDNVVAQWVLAAALYQSERFDECIAILNEVIKQRPEEVQPRQVRALAQVRSLAKVAARLTIPGVGG